jgi:hypothetical protein
MTRTQNQPPRQKPLIRWFPEVSLIADKERTERRLDRTARYNYAHIFFFRIGLAYASQFCLMSRVFGISIEKITQTDPLPPCISRYATFRYVDLLGGSSAWLYGYYGAHTPRLSSTHATNGEPFDHERNEPATGESWDVRYRDRNVLSEHATVNHLSYASADQLPGSGFGCTDFYHHYHTRSEKERRDLEATSEYVQYAEKEYRHYRDEDVIATAAYMIRHADTTRT